MKTHTYINVYRGGATRRRRRLLLAIAAADAMPLPQQVGLVDDVVLLEHAVRAQEAKEQPRVVLPVLPVTTMLRQVRSTCGWPPATTYCTSLRTGAKKRLVSSIPTTSVSISSTAPWSADSSDMPKSTARSVRFAALPGSAAAALLADRHDVLGATVPCRSSGDLPVRRRGGQLLAGHCSELRAARSEGVLGGHRGQGRRFSQARGAGVRVSGRRWGARKERMGVSSVHR